MFVEVLRFYLNYCSIFLGKEAVGYKKLLHGGEPLYIGQKGLEHGQQRNFD